MPVDNKSQPSWMDTICSVCWWISYVLTFSFARKYREKLRMYEPLDPDFANARGRPPPVPAVSHSTNEDY